MNKTILEIIGTYLPPDRFKHVHTAKSLQLEMHYNLHEAMYEMAILIESEKQR